MYRLVILDDIGATRPRQPFAHRFLDTVQVSEVVLTLPKSFQDVPASQCEYRPTGIDGAAFVRRRRDLSSAKHRCRLPRPSHPIPNKTLRMTSRMK